MFLENPRNEQSIKGERKRRKNKHGSSDDCRLFSEKTNRDLPPTNHYYYYLLFTVCKYVCVYTVRRWRWSIFKKIIIINKGLYRRTTSDLSSSSLGGMRVVGGAPSADRNVRNAACPQKQTVCAFGY